MIVAVLLSAAYLAAGLAYARWGPVDFDEYEAPNALACVTVLTGPVVLLVSAPVYLVGRLARFAREAGR
ncbi:hypothetical protein [Streptomyces sp. R44]|uniref:Uncharacterized protein n=1 Tax=Streptomyces sp. R44 TaxID=3238633 RepID=A0AB39T4M4_9ACTN